MLVQSYPTEAYLLKTIQGRHLFVELAPLALLVAEGVGRLLRGPAVGARLATMLLALAAFEAASLMALAGWHGWPAMG